MVGFVFVGFILGSVLGSFTKALADRSLFNKTFLGRSYCPNCKHKLGWYDLFPILSYLLLRGKCRYCLKEIGAEYLVVEFLMGILVAFSFWQSYPTFQLISDPFSLTLAICNLIFKVFTLVVLTGVALTDLKKMIIPDRIIIPSFIIALGFLTIITLLQIYYLYWYLSQTLLGRLLLPPKNNYFFSHASLSLEQLLGSIITGFVIGMFFLILIIITRGRGMGGGDLKLGVFLGMVLGFPNALIALFLSFLIGSVVAVLLILFGKKTIHQAIAFGPFLSIAGIITILWGQQILNWYLSLSV